MPPLHPPGRAEMSCCCWKVTNEVSRRCCRDLVERSSICNPHASKNSPAPSAAGGADEDAKTPSFANSFGILDRRRANEGSCRATVSARSPHSTLACCPCAHVQLLSSTSFGVLLLNPPAGSTKPNSRKADFCFRDLTLRPWDVQINHNPK